MASDNLLTITTDNFEAEVTKSDKPVLVDFWAEWCGPCKMLMPVIEEIANEQGDAVKIGKVNVDTEQSLAVDFNVRGIPRLIFFKDGKNVAEMGPASKDQIVAKLEELSL